MNASLLQTLMLLGGAWVATANSLPIDQFLDNDTRIFNKQALSNSIASGRAAAKSELQLMLSVGTGDGGNFGNVKAWHGEMRTAAGEKNPVDILATDDKTKIVLLMLDNGPVFSSTNSGQTWTVKNSPGKYEFPLSSDGGGFYARVTIIGSPTRASSSDWYAVGAADKNKLVVTAAAAHPAPALSITMTNESTLVSWPAAFTNFVLQSSGDLNTGNWTDVTNPLRAAAGENQVTLPLSAAADFYRLRSR